MVGEARILVVGAGNMGGAMLSGWLDAGLDPARITVLDPNVGDALRPILAKYPVRHVASVPEGERFDTVFLAVKPQAMGETLPPLKACLTQDALAISVAAGTTVSAIEDGLGERPVVRAMPNTPALIGRGITGAFANSRVDEGGRTFAAELLSSTGPLEWVESEAEIDAVTGVSGSGPAYVFLLAECMAKAGEAAGLAPEVAARLAQHTIAGAAELMLQSDEPPSRLRERVTSPNGTTAAALKILQGPEGLEPLMRRAILAARDRADELARR